MTARTVANDTANTITISATPGSGGGNTLDQAYDQGGTGAGRQINADAGAVNIAGPDGLTVNGNVGIGTTSATHKLTVEDIDANGTIDGFHAGRIILTRPVPDNGGLKNTQALYVESTYTSASGVYYAPKAIVAKVMNLSPGGNITEASALRGIVRNESNGSIDMANGLYTTLVNSSSGTIKHARGLFVASPFNLGTIENNYGLYIENQNTGLNSFAIYSEGGKSYFADAVGIGTPNPRGDLHVSSNGDTKLRFTNGDGNDATIVYDAGNDELEFRMGGDGTDPKFFIGDEGNVGIGAINPGNILTIQQNSPTDPIADAWKVYSSRRWKTNIASIENALDKVQRLRGVSFDWKADSKHDIGFIAEEVGKVFPELVEYEENGVDAKSVDYARLVAVSIEAIKEQQREIEKQKAIIESLSQRLAALENRNGKTE